MSPEQIRDARTVDARGDVWSMGVILYELLTGICPFDAETPGAIFTRIVSDNDNPRPISNVRPDVPPVLDKIVGRCILRKREDRYPNVLELARSLAPVVGPAGAAAVERIRAALSRPRAPTGPTWADQSGSISRLDVVPHPTNVSWTGSARGGTSRMALGAALGVLTFAVLGIVGVAVYRRRPPPPVPAAAIASESQATVPTAATPAPPPSTAAPASSDVAPTDSAAADSPSAAPSGHPWPRYPGTHNPRPSKQDLLRDRR
jgi:serine/threonine-protein kinase